MDDVSGDSADGELSPEQHIRTTPRDDRGAARRAVSSSSIASGWRSMIAEGSRLWWSTIRQNLDVAVKSEKNRGDLWWKFPANAHKNTWKDTLVFAINREHKDVITARGRDEWSMWELAVKIPLFFAIRSMIAAKYHSSLFLRKENHLFIFKPFSSHY